MVGSKCSLMLASVAFLSVVPQSQAYSLCTTCFTFLGAMKRRECTGYLRREQVDCPKKRNHRRAATEHREGF